MVVKRLTVNAGVVVSVRDGSGLAPIRPALYRFPLAKSRHTMALSERSRPAAIQFARPPYDAASMDFTNAARAGRSSLSILSSHIIESIGTREKIATMVTDDSTGVLI